MDNKQMKNPILEIDTLDGEKFKLVKKVKNIEIKPNYFISNKGRLVSVKKNSSNEYLKINKGQMSSGGYISYKILDKDNNSVTFNAHMIEMNTFYPLDNYDNVIIDHIDSNRTNNNIENLRYTTYSGNTKYAVDSGKLRSATDEQIIKSYNLSKNHSDEYVAKRVGLSENVIYRIRTKQGYYYSKILEDKDPIYKDRQHSKKTIDNIHI
jgi:hypothetical protein